MGDRAIDLVGNVADVLEIFAFAAWLLAAYHFWRRRAEYQRRLGLVRAQALGRPVALAVGLGGSIKGQVERYLADHGQPMEIIEVVRDGMVPQTEFPGVLEEVLEHKAELTRAGITDLHLFYKGPVSLAAAIGSIFNNWVPTTVYNLERDPDTGLTTYRADVVICRETSVGLPRRAGSR